MTTATTNDTPSEQAREDARTRRAWLADFLRARRQALQPEAVGLSASGRRRTPGLRREEVAVLAHVGVSWYTWLEQGRDIGVSTVVVDSIAQALRLDGADLEYFYHLTGKAPANRRAAADDLWGTVERMLENITRIPAYVADRYWNVVAANPLAAATFDIRVGTNCLERFFTDPEYASHYPRREVADRMMVAQFRRMSSSFPGDETFEILATEIASQSEEFRDEWNRHSVDQEPHVEIVYDHALGRLSFESVALTPVGGSDLLVFLYSPSPEPEAGLATARVLEHLGRL